ncbi:MAG: hypothetical protein QNJ55_07025 [Xenococcus sp. MO_188.B8]|nr:hypothetical protein [Xenococcus sp. MO_188.B8]
MVTSDHHLPRASAIAQRQPSADHAVPASLIATIILGSRGIAFTPIPIVDSTKPHHNESTDKIFRDIARSILWIFSGYTGANIANIKDI